MLNDPSEKAEVANVPKGVPGPLRQIVALFLKESKANKWILSYFALIFLGLICQFILKSFTPGPFLLVREMLVIPILASCAYGAHRMISTVSILPGFYFVIATFVSIAVADIFRKEGVTNAILAALGEVLFFALVILIVTSKVANSSLGDTSKTSSANPEEKAP